MSSHPWKHPADCADDSSVFFSLFPSQIGWIGVVGRGEIVSSVLVGHASGASVRRAVRKSEGSADRAKQLVEADWYPKLRQHLQEYAAGKRVDFEEFELQLPERTAFRDRVLAATRRLGYGETTTYGELAALVGHPKAARAVGTVMSTNRFPILIPCHRVLAAGGKLGGYTSPAGIGLKQRLLDMEQSG